MVNLTLVQMKYFNHCSRDNINENFFVLLSGQVSVLKVPDIQKSAHTGATTALQPEHI